MAYIVWTKAYSASDEGSILYAVNLGSLQADIAAVINGGITDINISASAAIQASKVTGAAGTSYTDAFTNADLVAGVLTVTHNMGTKYFNVNIFDGSDKMIIPNEVTIIDLNTASVDLNGYGTIAGTWNLRFSL